MNRWRQLKTWQKWGVGFGIAHILIYISAALFISFSCKVVGLCEGGLLLDLIEYPFYLMLLKILNISGYDHFYPIIILGFYPIIGTILWSSVGCVLGLFSRTIIK
jgi:hypothetical protein